MAHKARKTLFPILDNQLFHWRHLPPERSDVDYLMVEDRDLIASHRFHKHRIIHRLAAMRSHARSLRGAGFSLQYLTLEKASPDESYLQRLERILQEGDFDAIQHFEIEDRALEKSIARLARRRGLRLKVLNSPMFICTRKSFAHWIDSRRRPRMVDFYKRQRRELGILLNERGKPLGGRWSFDQDNRRSLPGHVPISALPKVEPRKLLQDVCKAVAKWFPDHPGTVDGFWFPYTSCGSKRWLEDFLEQRFTRFGDYQDAIARRSDTTFHSVLAPLLNCGLLTPDDVIRRALAFAEVQQIELNNTEGFVRQIIGWREFVRGIHIHYGDIQEKRNFWNHNRGLTPDWYAGTTGIDPLDDVIKKANRIGYAHHIERLMVVGNLMTLCEIKPRSAHSWFMEMFVDSDTWVMGPNVYGMALYSDGGIFASKPYICASNYLLKMSDYQRGDWCTTVDALFWRFVGRHRSFFRSQPRLSMMARRYESLDSSRRDRIESTARAFLDSKTVHREQAA
jgi:deoxyribodipyrimidine photolyase-related protein